ncbi:hypothetical protein C9925_00565 [cyanobacterium G8-9]|nr:hypothetical protein C9925_00565 [cyanobacterium G8-9]
MNDHNLDDLIIDTIAPKNNKTKSLLTIIALFIVVLIVAIILTKTLLKSPENAELSFEENLSEIIAPELKLQEPIKEVKVAKPQEESSLSTIIEEKITAPDEVEKPIEHEKIELPTIEDETVEEPVKETITVTEEVSSVPKIQKPIEKKIVKPKPTTKPKVVVKKPVVKPVTKAVKTPKVTKKAPKSTSTGKYYVQVGSFKDKPSTRFLSVIKSSGFEYHVTNPDRTGYKKLLIGPYKTRVEVDKARDIIRDRIHKSAFVVQK